MVSAAWMVNRSFMPRGSVVFGREMYAHRVMSRACAVPEFEHGRSALLKAF
jgi:hypothetical protein